MVCFILRCCKAMKNLCFGCNSFFMASKKLGSATRALVVEDIKVDCVILLRMLRKLNCEATVAHNGKEAVDLFLEGKTFDIVFFDKDMPLMTGPEVLQLLS